LSSNMKVALVLSILVLFIGLGYSFKISDFFDEDTQRQSSEVEDQILPVFTIAFFASLFNRLVFGLTNQNSGNTCQCGVRGVRGRSNGNRITGGEDAEPGEFPWQVRLELRNTDLVCGGTLLSSDTVLTTASCIGLLVGLTGVVDLFDWRIIVGDTDRNNNDGEQSILVREVIIHPNLDQNTLENNFGIIKLDSDVNFSNRIAPICLPTATTNYDDVVATLTGWGRETLAGFDLAILQKADVRTVPNARCLANPAASEICAVDDNANFCLNDLGSPLITNEGRFSSLIGIASINSQQLLASNCDPTEPGVYARVTSGLTWIEQQISGDTCPRPT